MGTPFHPWQLTAQGKSPAAHKGMIHAAKIMATTAQIMIHDAARREAAAAAHRKQLSENPYNCPIPAETMPPIAAE